MTKYGSRDSFIAHHNEPNDSSESRGGKFGYRAIRKTVSIFRVEEEEATNVFRIYPR